MRSVAKRLGRADYLALAQNFHTLLIDGILGSARPEQ